MTIEESQMIDHMLEDYRLSRESMARLAAKLSIMGSDRGPEGQMPTIVLMPSSCQSDAPTLPALFESLQCDDVHLHSKIG